MKQVAWLLLLTLFSVNVSAKIESCDEGLEQLEKTAYSLGAVAAVLMVEGVNVPPDTQKRFEDLSRKVASLNEEASPICLNDLNGTNASACSLAVLGFSVANQRLGQAVFAEPAKPHPDLDKGKVDAKDMVLRGCSQKQY